MGEEVACPGCGASGPRVAGKFEAGRPCPFCGLPAADAAALLGLEDLLAVEELREIVAKGRAELG